MSAGVDAIEDHSGQSDGKHPAVPHDPLLIFDRADSSLESLYIKLRKYILWTQPTNEAQLNIAPCQ